ncbi:MAG: ABC transporter permease [Acidobacteria bacterium]|nr:ABC transporter permease [Acidobacteriota bacterium]
MLKNYIKISLKVLTRRKFFTFISLFAISFTLIILMVVTAVFDHIFGPHSPETKTDRALGVYAVKYEGPDAISTGPAGYGFLNRYVKTLPGVENVTIFSVFETTYTFREGEKVKLFLKRTDGNFWDVFDFRFLEGAPYTADDEKNGNFVAVINQATRDKVFGGQSAVGKTLEIDGQRFRIAGVVANVPFLRFASFSDVWAPISTNKTASYRNQNLRGEFQALVLAKNKSGLPAIREEFQTRLANVEFPDTKQFNKAFGGLDTTFEQASRNIIPSSNFESQPGKLLAVIILFMVLFMILPTINLVNINVSRILERAGEIGVRKAFGASSWTLVGQFIVENVVLTLLGGLLGLIGSLLVLDAISRSNLIPYSEFQMNYRIFTYGLTLALFFGVFSGVYPAWKMSRLHPVDALKGGVR